MDNFQSTPSSWDINPLAREMILTLSDPLLKNDNNQAQYPLPPVDKAFINSTPEIALRITDEPCDFHLMHTPYDVMFELAQHNGLLQLVHADLWNFPTPTCNALLPPDNLEFLSDEHALTQSETANVHKFLEDFAVRGLIWAENYIPDEWFNKENADDAKHLLDYRSMMTGRRERILWLACRLSGPPSLRYRKDIIREIYFPCYYRWLEPLPKITHAVRSFGGLLSAASHRFIQ